MTQRQKVHTANFSLCGLSAFNTRAFFKIRTGTNTNTNTNTDENTYTDADSYQNKDTNVNTDSYIDTEKNTCKQIQILTQILNKYKYANRDKNSLSI